MKTPTPPQVRVRDHESLALLLVAPAGCGKTEALALRAAGLINAGRVSGPQRLLLTTFTNRARDNLRDRLRDYLSPGQLRSHVTVANFHGLATRLVRAHGAVIGIHPEIQMPESDWVADRCSELGLDWDARDRVVDLLRELKQRALTDAQLADELAARASRWATRIESERLADSRATYDDLLRYAELILANDDVAQLYRRHFAAVIVDEYQDLTPQQLRVLERIAPGRVTFAGDLAQGIYSFTGARPVELEATIRTMCTEVVTFDESHRSSPAVLSMVNAMNTLTGGQALRCADAGRWPAGGVAGRVIFAHAHDEAQWVGKAATSIVRLAPRHRVAVMSRVKSRLRFIDAHLSGEQVPIHRWEDGLLDTETAAIVRTMLTRLNIASLEAAPDKLAFLRELAGFDRVDESDTRGALADALRWVLERIEDGLTTAQIADRIQIGDQTTLLNAPGIHLLSGHVGKGQQFDWVIVIGAEDKNIPFIKAETEQEIEEEARVLGVMLSRARHGVVVTASDVVPTIGGSDRQRERSPFWTALDSAGARTMADLRVWLNSAPWDDLNIC